MSDSATAKLFFDTVLHESDRPGQCLQQQRTTKFGAATLANEEYVESKSQRARRAVGRTGLAL